MAPRRKKRLDPASFALPVERLRAGGSTDRAAARIREMLVALGRAPRVTVQITSERAAILGGSDESVALLKLCVDEWSAISVSSLYDGDRMDAGETVMTIEGPYDKFAHLEPMLLGTLARRTRVSTNARAFVDAARPKPVMAFPARHDHWLPQAGDNIAAQIGGALTISADSTSKLALVSHSLIGAFGGDTLLAARAVAEHVKSDVQVIVPVDYENDAVRTALDVARALEAGTGAGRMWGVQLSTSENLVDASIMPAMGAFSPTGVIPQLVWNVRNALDAEGLGDIKILASSGFTVDRIRQFEEEGVPVDAYGIGAALLAGRTGFTAALVRLENAADGGGSLRLRAGTELKPNARMEKVK
jgi:nicotinate phosphoribosyltransferase